MRCSSAQGDLFWQGCGSRPGRCRRLLRALLCAATTVATVPAALAAPTPSPSAATVPVRITFVAEVLGKPFACGTTYEHVSASRSRWQPRDLRLYVSDVVLTAHSSGKDAASDAVAWPLTLREDGLWQQSDVALLDFEDGTGQCQNGTAQTNREVVGEADSHAQQARGLRFVIGVPFAKNHADAAAALPPLDQAGLFWGWQGGYKFFSLDGRVDERFGHSFHVGSTGCSLGAHGRVATCMRPNRAEVVVPHFHAGRDEVVIDIGALLAHSDLGKTASPTHNGCMGEADNPACVPLMAAFGLLGTERAPARASVFSRRRR